MKAPPRTCNHHDEERCGAPATVVCRCADGLEWFACDKHKQAPSVPGLDAPVSATPIVEWFERIAE